jgi:hypothetical protein
MKGSILLYFSLLFFLLVIVIHPSRDTISKLVSGS